MNNNYLKCALISLFLLHHCEHSHASRPSSEAPEERPSSIRTRESFFSMIKQYDKRMDNLRPSRDALDARILTCIQNRNNDRSVHQVLIYEHTQWVQSLKDHVDAKQEALETALDYNLLTAQEANFQQQIVGINHTLVEMWTWPDLHKTLTPMSKIELWLMKKLHPKLYKK